MRAGTALSGRRRVSVRPAQPIVTTVIVIERVERVERRREMRVSSSEKQVDGRETEYLNTSKGRF